MRLLGLRSPGNVLGELLVAVALRFSTIMDGPARPRRPLTRGASRCARSRPKTPQLTYLLPEEPVAWTEHVIQAPHHRRSTSMRKILFMVGTALFSRVMAKRREKKAGGR
ncbi:hypothetical protein [Kocuria arenosa]|uniref:hypothetical protein n=1 Tax=Kocuria arenosa TaxID=3071446 RepID=UPI0034D5F299